MRPALPLWLVSLVFLISDAGAGRSLAPKGAVVIQSPLVEPRAPPLSDLPSPRKRRLHENGNGDESDPEPSSEDENPEVEQLLSRMSLREKIAQMAQIDINMLLQDQPDGTKALNEELARYWIGEVGVGSVLNTPGGSQPWTAEQFRNVSRQLQALAAASSTAHGRPTVFPIWGLDSVHGANYVHGATLSPQPLNLAATFNVTCSHWAGQVASRDTRAAGISWLFSPLLGIAVEPRWSRVYETFGEDPHVVGIFAKAMVDGIQDADVDAQAVPRRAAACAKHFVGYSAPRNGHDRAPSWIPTRHLYQYFVPPWKQVARQTRTVMESYTETDGVPNAANRRMLQRLLRQELRFGGVLVTDYEEMRNLRNWHRIRANTTDAIIGSLRETAIDVSMIPWDAEEFLSAVERGVQSRQLSAQRIDESVRRVLRLKLDLGLIGNGSPDSGILPEGDPNLARVGTDRHAALEVAQKSIVMAKNDKGTLPLENLSNRKVLVVGPTSDSVVYQSGGWTWQWQGIPATEDASKWFTYGTTVLQAVQALSHDVDVTHRCGVSILGGDCDDPDQSEASPSILQQVKDWIGWGDRGSGSAENSISRAVEAAEWADVILVCVGEEAYTEKPGDIRSLRLPQGQCDLVKALRAANSAAKLVLVYMGGRPRLLGEMVDQVDAVLLAFLAGPDAGKAVADIVVGKANPSGRLPITYPLEDDGGGLPYYHAVSDQCTRDDPNTPLPHYDYVPCPVQWEFGHGLSYTTFEYSDFTASGGIDRDLTVHVTVTNTGSREGSETILVFSFDEFRSTTPEYKRLRAFDKVLLQPNESKTLQFIVPVEDLKFIGPHDDNHYIIDPTMVTWVGVGTVDCRLDPTSRLCVRLESPERYRTYVAACDAACEVWEESGCAGQFGLSGQSCVDKCHAVSASPENGMTWINDGWGWDYVNCIESVVWGFRLSSDGTSCSKLITLCRNIFQTGNLDEFGTGDGWSGRMQFLGSCIALITALIASGIIVYLMNGGSFRRPTDEGDHIQFVRVYNRDDDDLSSR